MAFDDALELFDYWRDAPPAHEIVRLIGEGLGVLKPVPRNVASRADPADPSGIGALLAANPGGVVRA